MSRLSSIFDDADSDGILDSGETIDASYKYLGAGQIVEEDYVETQTKLTYLDSSGNVAGLDRFGRIVDQLWEDYGAIRHCRRRKTSQSPLLIPRQSAR